VAADLSARLGHGSAGAMGDRLIEDNK